MWEAFDHVSHEALDKLIAIIDVDRLGQRGETMLGWNTAAYARRAEASGGGGSRSTVTTSAIEGAYEEALAGDGQRGDHRAHDQGQGRAGGGESNGFHGKPLEDPEAAIPSSAGCAASPWIRRRQPRRQRTVRRPRTPRRRAGIWRERVATRRAFGDALTALATANGRIVALEGEVGDRPMPACSATRIPSATSRWTSPSSSWSPTRWVSGPRLDTVRPPVRGILLPRLRLHPDGGRRRTDIGLVGSHCGVSIGEDGPSQMALEGIAALRSVQGSTVLYPSARTRPPSSSRRWSRSQESST